MEREFQESAPGLVVGCYYGGVDIGQQIRQLRSGVDVAVGTPGRFIDLINRGNLDLGMVHFLGATPSESFSRTAKLTKGSTLRHGASIYCKVVYL